MNWRQGSLDILGLNDTERAILESLRLARGVQEIAQETKLSRTGINYSIKQLKGKGLLYAIKQGKRNIYIALTSQELIHKFQHNIDELTIAGNTKKGVRIKTSKEDEFVIHVGAKEIIPAYERIASMNKNERIKAIQHHRSYNKLLEKITPQQLIKFNQAVIENKLIIDGILNESAYQAYRDEIKKSPQKFKAAAKSLEGRMADYAVFSDNLFDHDAEIWIFKKTTLIINWQEEVAIEIINASMTSFLRDMFEFVKQGSQKIDHNKVMRNILAEK